MAIAPPTPQLLDTLVESCHRTGLDGRGARLIHHYTNAVFHLPAERAVVRITSRGSHPHAIATSQICDWLVREHDYPATRPLPGSPVLNIADSTVTFWVYYDQPQPAAPLTSTHLADLLRRLHSFPAPPHPLPNWQPLTSVEATVRGIVDLGVLTDTDREWLLEEITDTRSQLAGLDWPLGLGLIHGDAWAGNLLWDFVHGPHGASTARPLLGDWDGLAYGPREVDLIPTWHAATRYGRGPAWVDAFIAGYGYDLTAWKGYPILARMRDLVQLSGPLRRTRPGNVFERVLHQRLAGIRTRDTSVWTAL